MVRARVTVKAVFNTTGCTADAGRIIRALIVVCASTAFVLAILGGLTRARATDASCLPQSIKAALTRADAACGIEVISTFRPHAVIAGTRHASLHAVCRAADFTSHNYACVYRVLAGWRGKMSMDATRVRHVHIDDGRYARFLHGQSRRYAKRQTRIRLARGHGRRG